MARYALLALVAPLPGQAVEYKEWHERQHVPEVLRVPCFRSATGYDMAGPLVGESRWRLMALYEIDTGDIDACIDELKVRLADGRVSSSPHGDPERRTLLTWSFLSSHRSDDVQA